MHRPDTSRARRASLALAGIGIASHVLAVLVAAARAAGYVAGSHPAAVLGASGMPGASVFNVVAYVVPGACAALCAWRVRAAIGVHAHWLLRIGVHMLLLAGIAFAAQGVWSLDLTELDGGRSRGHATAWMLWVVSSVAGGVAVSIGLAMRRGMARAMACAVATLVMLAAAMRWLPFDAGHALQAAVAAWAALVLLLAATRGTR